MLLMKADGERAVQRYIGGNGKSCVRVCFFQTLYERSAYFRQLIFHRQVFKKRNTVFKMNMIRYGFKGGFIRYLGNIRG